MFLAYLDGLHLQSIHSVTYSKIWIITTAVCMVILVLVVGFVVAHKKKRRKNSISSDSTDMAFSENQIHGRDVSIHFYYL